MDLARLDTRVLDSVAQSVGRITEVNDIDGLDGELALLADQFGFSSHLLLLLPPGGKSLDGAAWVHRLPEGFEDAYRENDLVREDPVIQALYERTMPFTWSEVTTEETPALRLARDFGMADGLCFPVRTPRGLATVIFQDRGNLRMAAGRGAGMMPMAYAAVDRFLSLDGIRTRRPSTLTVRERECLAWCAEGKTAWEIGVILGVSEQTVLTHLDKARRKLDAANRAHAAAKALRLGWL